MHSQTDSQAHLVGDVVAAVTSLRTATAVAFIAHFVAMAVVHVVPDHTCTGRS